MLQRAASNAYSWWWASNIRTGQSKWLDNNLQDMEEKVNSMIKLIQEDADTFAKKAEMYYQRRPVVIKFVEEAFREYKALADRYDHISGELHKANHTIATAFPDQVQQMQDEDGSPKAMVIDATKLIKPSSVIQRISAINRYNKNQTSSKKPHSRFPASPVDKETAQEEIDRLQKEILVLQTEKEFVKSTYENGLAKYMEIEKQITEMQEEVSCLQDEFSVDGVIEDDEARALMAATALKSCEDSLFSLQAQQKRSIEEAQVESKRIRKAKRKLKALKSQYGQPHVDTGDTDKSEVNSTTGEDEVVSLNQERLELQSMCEKVKEHFETSSDTSVVELAEKIDELVDKVISLEFTVTLQNALITRLRSQTDELQKHLHILEEDKVALSGDSNMLSGRLKQAEEELHRVQDLEKSVQDEKGMLQTHFTEACHSLNDLSEKLQSPRHQDQINQETSPQEREDETIQRSTDDLNNEEQIQTHSDAVAKQEDEIKEPTLLNGTDSKEKILLEEYTTMLESYRDTKKKLSEVEKKNQDSVFEMIAEMRELRSANARMDEELQSLRQKLGTSEATPLESADSSPPTKRPTHRSLRSRSLYSIMTEERYRESKKLDATFFTNTVAEDNKLESLMEESHASSAFEDKFRRDIDSLLEDNLDFWLKFCTSYHQIQKFKTTFHELEAKVEKLKDNKKQEGSASGVEQAAKQGSLKDNKKQEGNAAAVEQAANQGSAPADKKLRELKTELQVWLEQNALLKGELKNRSLTLSNIEEEISRALKESAEGGIKFTPYQAAKFHGEVINMQQENNKVVNELQTGMDQVRELQMEVGRVLSNLHESFELKSHHTSDQLRHLSSKSRVPLRTFLFGTKPKKTSIFSCMNPAMRKQINNMKHSIMN